MDKVYIVQGSSGSWDDHTIFTIGVYTSPQQADEAKTLWLAKLMEYKNRYTSEEQEKFDEMNIKSDELVKYNRWRYSGLGNSNGDPWVKEVELNKMIFKFDEQ